MSKESEFKSRLQFSGWLDNKDLVIAKLSHILNDTHQFAQTGVDGKQVFHHINVLSNKYFSIEEREYIGQRAKKFAREINLLKQGWTKKDE